MDSYIPIFMRAILGKPMSHKAKAKQIDKKRARNLMGRGDIAEGEKRLGRVGKQVEPWNILYIKNKLMRLVRQSINKYIKYYKVL